MMSPRLQSPVFTSKFIHAAVFWGLRFLTGCWQDSSVPCHVGYGCSQYGSWFLPNWVIQKKENNRDRSCSVSYNIISEVTCHLCCQSFIDDPLYNVEGDSTRMWSLGPSWKLVSRWEHTTHRWRNKITNKLMKRCPLWLISREIQIKISRNYFIPQSLATVRLTIPNVSEDVGKRNSCSAARKKRWN